MFEQWDREVFHAVERYVAGDVASALSLLSQRDAAPAQQRDLYFSRIARESELGHLATWPHPPWTPALMRALAALHMEGALDAYKVRDEEKFKARIALGEEVFAYVARRARRRDSAPDWELAIGLTAMSEARRIIADFKSRYVLLYALTGVSPAGWYPIEVSVRTKGADVRARRGYTR